MELIIGDRTTFIFEGREIPATHVGKSYNVLAHRDVRMILEEVGGAGRYTCC